jgi:biotin operon repressor
MEKELFHIIRQETPRNMLLTFLNYLVCSQNDLSELLEKHPTTIEYHLKKLIDMGIIMPVESKNGRTYVQYNSLYKSKRVPNVNEKLYAIKEIRAVVHLFYDYQKTFKEDKIFKFAFERWLEVYYANKRRNNKEAADVKSWFDSRIDCVIDIFFDIFPPPFVS